ncbi:MAG: methylated-DNA--[protein]-cysteine S-methyltransferase [Chloroflexi bacterium]|jgi:methylated-DNA-[protein]-cysteine S-methyltransferase|nr:methylated-DNA--[protein]-cysteine S-methyltransferase [Chloroflexota bacterium]MBT3670845.1 methylated-DNA--[protein]-cysteine S-methyltransferase [Chloroflexota bacterium]MBT4002969.1 methylated-DNA--[protein]-cysteine S-methyltransferase [Chloroflexota bacterium]MBT4305304.1 methylated-DNA--[protein]-cysteine S-methyltransferase [Chloroflexota bacterium]MBT4532450.1 methylated-DNA--[protein]-cysteine S-methyltransferase [Chloroflexota bacterium]
MSKENEKADITLNNFFEEKPSSKEIERAEKSLISTMETVMPPKIFYTSLMNTPLGTIWFAATEKGLIAIEYDLSEQEFIAWLGKKIKARFINEEENLKPISEKIVKYLSGEIRELDLDIDFTIISPFQKEVLLATKAVPRGQTSTYGEIAKIIGKPKAFQAVGQALRYNPIPIALPCHRVIASDGSLGGYAGEMDSERKRKLLALEGAMLF